MAPVFLSAVLILAKKIVKVDSYRCCGTVQSVVDVFFSGDLTQYKVYLIRIVFLILARLDCPCLVSSADLACNVNEW